MLYYGGDELFLRCARGYLSALYDAFKSEGILLLAGPLSNALSFEFISKESIVPKRHK
jgi:hypothetical protein